jgi:hypothetical protein
MDRQTLRDWVIRSVSKERMVSSTLPRLACRRSSTPRTAPFWLARGGRSDPGDPRRGTVALACDLIMRLHEEFGLSVSDDTIYRALKDLGWASTRRCLRSHYRYTVPPVASGRMGTVRTRLGSSRFHPSGDADWLAWAGSSFRSGCCVRRATTPIAAINARQPTASIAT